MKTLGLLLILCGTILCGTIFLWFPGLIALGVGALLCMAGRGSQPGRVAQLVHKVLLACVTLVVIGGALFWYGLAKYGLPSKRAADSTPAAAAQQQRKPAKRAAAAGPQGR